jgi:long-chain acyl-CoA synthetase
MATQLQSDTTTQSGPPLRPVERDTLTKLFLHAVDRFDRPDAVRYKAGGKWHVLSHRELELRVSRLAAALQAMGIERGDRVALLSENRPEWAITDFAALGIGAVDVPIYPTLPANQIRYILADSGCKAVFVSTREQLAKIQEIRGELSELRHVIAFDDPGAEPGVRPFDDVLAEGQRIIESGAASDFRAAALAVTPDDLATLIYTSGTTGDPKGVMLSHWNLASNVGAVHQHHVIALEPGEVVISFLPLSHVLERMVDYYYFDSGVSLAYAESIEKLADNLLEVSPEYMVSVPRVFEKIYAKVMGSAGIKGLLVAWAKRVGEGVIEERFAGREPSALAALQYKLADALVFSKLRERTGGALRAAISGGAPLSADIAKFFFAAGIPVYEGYGLTETSPVLTANKPGKVRLGTVGTVVPGTEIRLGEAGEILVRGPQVMKGYWKQPEATEATIDAEGWLHTGDVGEFDADGFLRITDRIRNFIATAGGKKIAPQPIENDVAMSRYIAQVMMVGDRRPYSILLVVPDYENLRPWAQQQGIDASSPARLARDPRVVEFLQNEAFSQLQGLARYEMPKKIAVIADEFTVDSGLMTPTLKIKRKEVEARYRDRIEELYSDGHAHE